MIRYGNFPFLAVGVSGCMIGMDYNYANLKNMDSIGLGDFLANGIIMLLLAFSVFIFLLFKKRSQSAALIWLSCSLNIVSILYFMGAPSYFVSIFNIFVWPVINIVLIAWYVRKK